MAATMDPVPMSDFHTSDISGSRNRTPRQHVPRGSSARPLGPPSESVAPHSDDEGFADDQVIPGSNRPRNALDRPIPRVEDMVGLAVQEHFEKFLEKQVIQRFKSLKKY